MKKSNSYSCILDNLYKLNIGQIYTYNELCRELKIKATGGYTRKKQMTILKSLLEIEEVKRGKYTIKAFKDVSKKEKINLIKDRRGQHPNSRGNYKGVFGEYFMNVLCFRLRQYSENEGEGEVIKFIESKERIKGLIGLINENNYLVAENTPYYFCEKIGIDYDVYVYLFPIIQNAITNTVENVLSMFHNRKLGTVEKIVLINETKDCEKLRKATYSENKRIYEIKEEVALELGYRSSSMIYYGRNKTSINKFHNKLNLRLKNELEIYTCYQFVEINILRENLTNYLNNISINTIDENMAIGKRKFIEQRLKYIHRSQNIIYNEKEIEEKLQNNGVVFYNVCNLKENFYFQAEKLLESIIETKENILVRRYTDIMYKGISKGNQYIRITAADIKNEFIYNDEDFKSDDIDDTELEKLLNDINDKIL